MLSTSTLISSGGLGLAEEVRGILFTIWVAVKPWDLHHKNGHLMKSSVEFDVFFFSEDIMGYNEMIKQLWVLRHD